MWFFELRARLQDLDRVRRSPYRPAASRNAVMKRPERRTHSITSYSRLKSFLHQGRQPEKNHASIDRRHGFVRGWNVTSASAYDGAQLRNVLDKNNTGSTVWADTAYRSKKNEAWLEKHGYFSDIHHKKPKGRPMSEAMARANGRRSEQLIVAC